MRGKIKLHKQPDWISDPRPSSPIFLSQVTNMKLNSIQIYSELTLMNTLVLSRGIAKWCVSFFPYNNDCIKVSQQMGSILEVCCIVCWNKLDNQQVISKMHDLGKKYHKTTTTEKRYLNVRNKLVKFWLQQILSHLQPSRKNWYSVQRIQIDFE